jgi:hypothetical protein
LAGIFPLCHVHTLSPSRPDPDARLGGASALR